MRATLIRQFEHGHWANARALSSLDECRGSASPAVLLFAHILGAEAVWFDRAWGAIDLRSVPLFPQWDLHDCRERFESNGRRFLDRVRSTTEAQLAERIVFSDAEGPAADGERYELPLADILNHVALHGHYHRAQIAASVRAAGGTPARTDFIVFCCDRE